MGSHGSLGRRSVGRSLGVLGASSATVAALVVLWPDPLGDVFVTGIVGGAAAVAVVGGVAAWTGRRVLLWAAALTVAAISLVGLLTVGFLFVPAGLSLLGAAALSGWAGPLVAEPSVPPTPRTALIRTLAGCVSVGGGAWLVRVAAFDRELFGSCGVETASCVLATTNWLAVSGAVAGLVAVAGGGWLLLRGLVAARALVRGVDAA